MIQYLKRITVTTSLTLLIAGCGYWNNLFSNNEGLPPQPEPVAIERTGADRDKELIEIYKEAILLQKDINETKAAKEAKLQEERMNERQNGPYIRDIIEETAEETKINTARTEKETKTNHNKKKPRREKIDDLFSNPNMFNDPIGGL